MGNHCDQSAPNIYDTVTIKVSVGGVNCSSGLINRPEHQFWISLPAPYFDFSLLSVKLKENQKVMTCTQCHLHSACHHSDSSLEHGGEGLVWLSSDFCLSCRKLRLRPSFFAQSGAGSPAGHCSLGHRRTSPPATWPLLFLPVPLSSSSNPLGNQVCSPFFKTPFDLQISFRTPTSRNRLE